MKCVDVRGLSCPEPVIRARQAMAGMKAGEQAEILVESETARENVLRAAGSMGCTAELHACDGGYRLVITKQ